MVNKCEQYQVLKLHEHSEFLEECCNMLNDEWPRSTKFRMLQLLQSRDNLPTSLVLIDARSRILLGHISVKRESTNVAVLWSMIIRRDRRGRGLGRLFLEHVEVFIREMGFTEIRLTTTDQVSFYMRSGFQLIKKDESKIGQEYRREYPSQPGLAAPPPPPPPMPLIRKIKTGMIKIWMNKMIIQPTN